MMHWIRKRLGGICLADMAHIDLGHMTMEVPLEYLDRAMETQEFAQSLNTSIEIPLPKVSFYCSRCHPQ